MFGGQGYRPPEVGDGVWVRQSEWVWTNSIVVRGEDGGPVPGEIIEHRAHAIGHAAILLADRGLAFAVRVRIWTVWTSPAPGPTRRGTESTPNGIRTRVTSLKGRRPRPLDDGGLPHSGTRSR